MSDKKIGLIAGAGLYPLSFAEEASKMGYKVYVVSFKGITNSGIEDISEKVKYFNLGQISAPIKFFRENGVKKVVMAGNVPHISIFGNLYPDLRAAKILFRLKSKRANAILNAISDELRKDDIELVNSATFLENLLPKPGLLTSRKPSKKQVADIEFGWKIAKQIAEMDIGLTVVVKEKTIISVEALEGTDECIKRAGQIFKRNSQNPENLVVVKVARPRQDMRFDLPVVGAKTIESMISANATLLAIEAYKTLILEKPKFLKKANENRISVLAVNPAVMIFRRGCSI